MQRGSNSVFIHFQQEVESFDISFLVFLEVVPFGVIGKYAAKPDLQGEERGRKLILRSCCPTLSIAIIVISYTIITEICTVAC